MNNTDPLTLANAFIQAGELDDALDALNQHLEANPEDDDARRLRVQVLMRMEWIEEENLRTAAQDYQKLKERTPEDEVQYGAVLEGLNNFGDALVIYTHLVCNKLDKGVALDRILRILRKLRNVDQAETTILKVLPVLAERFAWRAVMFLYAEIALWQGDANTALERISLVLDSIQQQYPGDKSLMIAHYEAQILLKRADVYQRLQSLSEADADYAAVEQIILNDRMISFNRGLIALLQGDSERGIELCRNAYTNAPAALREEMQKALVEDERYAPIAAALEA